MKKFLCVFLTLTTLLSSMVFVVSAAEESDVDVIWISDGDSTINNAGFAGYAGIDKEDKTQGEGSILSKHTTGTYGAGGFMWQWKFDPAKDISNATHLCVDIYISDPGVLSGNLQLELTSSGRADAQEHMYDGITLKQGWNTIEIPMAAFAATDASGLDFTAFNYLRLFNCVAVNVSGECIVKIDNFRFEDRGDTIEFTVKGDDDVYHVMNEGSVGTTDAFWFADQAGKIIYAFEMPDGKTQYINKIEFNVTIAGTEQAVLVSSDCKNWKTVYSTTSGTNSKKNIDLTPGVDLTKSKYVYVAIADADTSTGNGGQLLFNHKAAVTISYTDIQLRAAAEFYSFKVRTDSEKSYLVSTNGTNHKDQPMRYHDKTNNTVWKYVLSDVTDIQNISWTARLGGSNGCLIQVSQDGTNYVDVYSGSPSSSDIQTFSLLEYIDIEALKEAAVPTLWIKIADSTPEGGNGGSIYSTYYTTLVVLHNPPPATGLTAMVEKIFTAYKILAKIPFLSKMFGIAD